MIPITNQMLMRTIGHIRVFILIPNGTLENVKSVVCGGGEPVIK